MKKALSLFLVLAMVFSFAACSKQGSSGSVTGFSEADLYLEVAGKKISCDSYADEIISTFGDDYEYSEGMSCAYDGMDKVFSYPDIAVYTRPDGDKDVVVELYVSGGEFKSSKGIALGSSGEDVRKAYGEPTNLTSRLLSYELEPSNTDSIGASLYFEMDGDGKVTGIGVTGEVLDGEEW